MAGRRVGLFFGACMLGLALLAGCSGAKPLPVTGATGQAAVQAVEVMENLTNPGEVRLLVKGTLPDTCTRLADPVVSRSGGLAVVILMQQPLPGQKDCQAVSQPFERIVSLGADLAPGRYTASVNGVQQVFDRRGFDLPAQAAAVPTATRPAVAAAAPGDVSPTAVSAAAASPADVQADPKPAAAGQAADQAAPNQPAAIIDPAPLKPPEPAAPPPASQPGACENKAAFFADVSTPDGTIFDPGQVFTKTWRIRNAGTCAWQGYAVVFQGGDPLSQETRVALAGTVAAGDTVDISVSMTAPQKPGSYYSDWLISASDGSTFGLGAGKNGLLWTKIGVRALVPVTGGAPSCAYQPDSAAESQVLDLINQARAERGLTGLRITDKLSAAARGHAQDMACQDFVEHYGSDGSTWYNRIQAQGVRYRSASENIYAGNPQFGGTPEGAFAWWMNSQIHRDNILNPAFTQIGIGYVYYDGSTYKGYYTLNFITP